MNFLKRVKVGFIALLPHHFLSRCMGFIANCQCNWFKNALIKWFIRHYRVNVKESEYESLEHYPSFNSFFVRKLKPNARIIDPNSRSIISPADGYISQLGMIHNGQLLQAKNHLFSLSSLLSGIDRLTDQFQEGAFATIYLSPKDYHRVHLPTEGMLKEMIYVPGRLFPVNKTSTEYVPKLFSRNERVISIFETKLGPMALIMVGATFVASIKTVWAGVVTPRSPRCIDQWFYPSHHCVLKKGDEMGQFQFGSTVIILFGPRCVQWREQWYVDASIQMGQALGNSNE